MGLLGHGSRNLGEEKNMHTQAASSLYVMLISANALSAPFFICQLDFIGLG
jgi:hypothetical protein